MKRLKIIFYLILLPAVISACSVMADQVDESKLVAKINGKEILSSDVDPYVEKLIERAKSMGQEVTPEIEKNIRNQWIDRLVAKELFLQQARAEKITVTDEEIETGMGIAQSEGANLPPEELKAMIKEDLLISKVIEFQVISKIVITDQESEDLYNARKDEFKQPEQIRASHILIKADPSDPQEKRDAAKKKIESVLTEVRAGKDDFGDLARKYSEGPSASKGGDLGFFSRGQMVAPFEEAAFKLDKGGISDVVETMFGYHIIKVEDKKEASTVAFEDAKEDIKYFLMRQRSNEKIEAWIKELKDKATIEIF
jgi:peptidyl-prolyl cis-trans isomerase C